MIEKIKIKEIEKDLILAACEERYANNTYTHECYKDKKLLLSFFDKALKSVSNYCLDNINGDIKNGKEIISQYSRGYTHDSYVSMEEVIKWFASHEVFCEMGRLYNCQINK